MPVGFGLAPLAVRAAHRRRGIAERLVRRGLELCRCDLVRLVVVLGDPHYYQRFGFRPARLWSLRDEYQGGNAFQVLELVSGTTPLGGGLVKYAPGFAAVGI
jgi:putative acetyltransferase